MQQHVKILNVVKEMRVAQWPKNALIFLALLWVPSLSLHNLAVIVLGFLILCFVSSIVYLHNDIKDKNADRMHPQKQYRPYAFGSLILPEMIWIGFILALASGVGLLVLGDGNFLLIILAYVVVNVLYTLGLKHVPVIEFLLIACTYVFRTLAGFILLQVSVPFFWLIAIYAAGVFLTVALRIIEMVQSGSQSRPALKRYTLGGLRMGLIVALFFAVVLYFVGTASITGPLAYTDAFLLFIMLYVSNLLSSVEFIKDLAQPNGSHLHARRLLYIVSGAFIASLLILIIFKK